jgi:hypothetical protein
MPTGGAVTALCVTDNLYLRLLVEADYIQQLFKNIF